MAEVDADGEWGTMRKYLHCLAQPHALSLLSSNFFGRLPNGMSALAIVLFLRAHDVPYAEVGTAAALYGLCSAVGGPVLGRIVDQRGQLVTLLSGAIGSGLGFVLLAVLGADSLPMALIGVALAGFLMPPLEPALRSMWSSVLPDESTVEVAYALDTALQNILFVAGPLMVVGLAALTSTTAALLVIGTLGIAGAATFVSIRPVRAWRGEPRARDWAGALRSRLLLMVLLGMMCIGGVVGVLNVATVAYAEQAGLPGFSGVLLGAFSFGSLIGGLGYGARNWSGDPLRRMVFLVLGLAVCTWPLVFMLGAAGTVALMAVAGFGLAPVLTCGFVLIGKIAPRGTVTEAFAWVTAVFLGGSAIGSAIVGSVLPVGGLRGAFVVAGLAATAGFLVVLVAASVPALRPQPSPEPN
ncbi:MFS transporter [Kutzneria buriramensis]|uniref:Putative MFS family arabinose efflux permease n=1 Tax=Kutzneria buriramensis TaxID=1045776 RepID=A0A3E0G5N9_9PSEU|nr:MFS transporter [Kutzneria buriramensis]REH18149.1 putative MFS family arabinose efflux permease [Kutzneria buriramensis]